MFENKIMELLPVGIKVEKGLVDTDFKKEFIITIKDSEVKNLTFERTKKSEWFYLHNGVKLTGKNLVRLCVKSIIANLMD